MEALGRGVELLGGAHLDKTIARIEGRSADIPDLPARAGGHVAVHPYRLGAPFAYLPDIRQYQLLHAEHGLHARILLRPAAPTDTPAHVRAALLDALNTSGAVPPPVHVTAVTALEREPGPGAKLKLIKTTTPPPPDSPAG